MPTNVSTPIWRCDLCGTTLGENFNRAELCESAPVPAQLPDGSPLLRLDKGGFSLVPLEPMDSGTSTS